MSSASMSSNASSGSTSLPNRWVIAIAAFFLQLALGAVYAWSVFLKPVQDLFSAHKPEASLTFTITIVVLGITASFGGYFQSRFGPRTIATAGGVLYGLGSFFRRLHPACLYCILLTA